MTLWTLSAALSGAKTKTLSHHHVWTLNVLLIDDDLADSTLILDVLKRHPSVSAAFATDSAKQALDQMEAGRLRPDLVLLDIHMPRMSGFEVLRKMRDIPDMNAVPVVFLTTSGLHKDVIGFGASSAASYVIKPDTYEELQNRLDGVIRKAASGAWTH
jgi:DNA-binding response OmpR family regulator